MCSFGRQAARSGAQNARSADELRCGLAGLPTIAAMLPMAPERMGCIRSGLPNLVPGAAAR